MIKTSSKTMPEEGQNAKNDPGNGLNVTFVVKGGGKYRDRVMKKLMMSRM